MARRFNIRDISFLAKPSGDHYHGSDGSHSRTMHMEMPPTLTAKRKAKPRRTRKSSRKTAGKSSFWTWLLGLAVVVIVAGIGLLKWAETRRGQAALLTLGSQKMYCDVQSAVEQALLTVLPDLAPGAAASMAGDTRDPGMDMDWPAPGLGPAAAIRCRKVAVPENVPWWEVQQQVAGALEEVGARVLWGQRLYPQRMGLDQTHPNEDKDLLRLDVGVLNRPTHTLVLYRRHTKPKIHWGSGRSLTQWETLAADRRPTIALVVDDWGNNTNPPTTEILDLPIPLTMSVLPGRPFSRFFALKATDLILPVAQASAKNTNGKAARSAAVARRLAAGCPVVVTVGKRQRAMVSKRREVILHLPMEPQGYPAKDPGKGAVMVGMSEAEIAGILDQDLKAFPSIAGLNNHMGSAATSDAVTMVALMKELKKRGLFFLDSLTTSRSVAYHEALKAGIPALRNRTFLDYDLDNPAKIKANLEVLVAAARKGRFVVGICHPHPRTAEVLTREIPRLRQAGIRFVTLSELLALNNSTTGTTP